MSLVMKVEDASGTEIKDPIDLLVARQDELIALQAQHIERMDEQSRKERELNEKTIQLHLELAKVRMRMAALAGLSAGIAISIAILVLANSR